MLLTFVIPTRNRPDNLQVAVRSIADQVGSLDSVRIIVLDDSEGARNEAETRASIDRLCADYPLVSAQRVTPHVDYADTFRHMFMAAPDSDWVWTFGDDDRLQPGALDFIVKRLEGLPPEIAFLHVAERRRASGANAVFNGRTLDVFCSLGWIEMTGFITGNVTRGRLLYEAAQSPLWRTYAKSAFVQSCALLERLKDEQMQFVDIPLIDTQDDQQTESTLENWRIDHISERYMYLSQAIEMMFETGILTQKLPEKFFRYIRYHMWDRFITYFLADYINDGAVWHEDWGMHIKRFADFLQDDAAAAAIRADVDQARALVTLHAALKGNADFVKNQLQALFDARNKGDYPQQFVTVEKVAA